MPDKQKMYLLLTDLLKVLNKHNAELEYTTADDGIHAYIDGLESPGFFDREELSGAIDILKLDLQSE